MTKPINRRVVITGMGLVTPLGIGVKPTWASVCAGQSGIGEITRFDCSAYATKIAAEVKDFKPQDFMPKKDARRVEPFIAYALAATRMAIEDSGLVIDSSNETRVGVITGCGLGGLRFMEDTVLRVSQEGPRRVSPFFIPMMIGNMAPGLISVHFGARGPNSSLATACAAGAHAVGNSYRLIQNGTADAMITGGTEGVISPSCIAGFNSMKALSTRNDEPQKASRPFDKDRDGFVVGEGGGILIIEALDHAIARNAPIYAEISGYGMSGDGYHMTSPPPDGNGAVRCMAAALEDAGINGDQIDYINAHGTSTPLNDLYETRAIKTVFKEYAYSLPVSSTKSMTGHLLGGAGGIEMVFTALSIYEDMIPPTINYENPDEDCDLDYVPNTARSKKVEYAMTNSFGFGGTNATLILKKYKE
ncbi:MAG: beta-ketoacyl-ACP synthase II [Desulfobacteraceae bacterium]|nr:beta-ketoacyl-ACP synthase II [Desulfobacteraceae bacterium]